MRACSVLSEQMMVTRLSKDSQACEGKQRWGSDGLERGNCALQDWELTVTADLKHITFSCVRLRMPREFAGFSSRGKIHSQPNAVPF